eukprot:1157298-Pelagomonas_calceolata.AAC.3
MELCFGPVKGRQMPNFHRHFLHFPNVSNRPCLLAHFIWHKVGIWLGSCLCLCQGRAELCRLHAVRVLPVIASTSGREHRYIYLACSPRRVCHDLSTGAANANGLGGSPEAKKWSLRASPSGVPLAGYLLGCHITLTCTSVLIPNGPLGWADGLRNAIGMSLGWPPQMA